MGTLYLYEAKTFFILSRQRGIPLETDGISAKVGQKSLCKCFIPGSFLKYMLQCLPCDLKYLLNMHKNKTKNLNVIDELSVVPCLTESSGFCIDYNPRHNILEFYNVCGGPICQKKRRNLRSSITNLVYELPHKLPNILRLVQRFRTLVNSEILEKSQIWVDKYKLWQWQ